MDIRIEGNTAHLFMDDGGYIGSVACGPDGEVQDSSELAYRLGVRATPFNYDFAVMAGALGTYKLSRAIPKGATVFGGHYKVDTTATSADDSGTMSLGIEAAADLLAATAISTGTTFDAATPVLLPNGAKDTVTLTEDRQVTAVIGTQVWTAGKFSGVLLWTFEDARAKSFVAA